MDCATNNGRISVVVPAHNAEQTIGLCVQSLLNQRGAKGPYEIIVIDNNSTDDTPRILSKYKNRIKILSERNRGSYCARNLGIRNAIGDILAFTDADCVADREWLAHLAKAFEDKRVKLVGGSIRASATGSALLRYCDVFCHPQEMFFRSSPPFFATSNMSVRKPGKGRAVLFDESLQSGGDVEFCSRMVDGRSEMLYEPRAVVRHCYHDSLVDFMRKHHYYGKWHAFRKQRLSIHTTVPLPGYVQLAKDYGTRFLLLRMLQDISYRVGVLSQKGKKL
jgi:glycosyltransferase involved in cell wall biosynthesis